MRSLSELVIAVHTTLAEEGVAHGFGDALALGYVIEPRGTVDVDVCVFLPESDLNRIDAALGRLGLERTTAEGPPIAGERYVSPDHPFSVDVFPAVDARYDRIEQRLVTHLFGADPVELPFLSPEDVVLFKLSFGRTKDWQDLTLVGEAGVDLDVAYIEEQLIGLRGPSMHPRLARFRSILRKHQSS
jgi:hypothetical protein